ncbi:MAG: ABC transporter ATP-binding protein [Eubacteriaceae bacterium]|jgi:ABC-2 type transport system ATP-binding protein
MLSIKNLSKTYPGGKKAVDHISLEVEAGDIYGFIGHNGAGKTTTIKAVTGIIDFEEGEISIDGHNIVKEPLEAKRITAFLPDNPDLYDQLTGIQYLNFISDIFEIDSKEREKRIKEYADAFELTGDLGNLISSYSHGMKQKLALISALIHKPRLLVLDEPFVGLDPESSITLKRYMHELCDQGSAIFFSTHVLDTAEKLCNKIAIIKEGRIIDSGKIEDLTHGDSLEDVFMEAVVDDDKEIRRIAE